MSLHSWMFIELNPQVEKWFRDLVQDKQRSNIAEATSIDIKALGKIVAKSSVTMDPSARTRTMFKREIKEETVVDIGVLRYLFAQDPRFQVGLIGSSILRVTI